MAVGIAHWRAYYENGAIYTDKADKITDCPLDGILGLVIFTTDNRKFRLTGGDYFYVDLVNKKWGIDKNLDITAMTLKYSGSYFIRGRWTDDASMKEVERRMKTDAP